MACAAASYNPALIATLIGGGNQAKEGPAASSNVQEPQIEGHAVHAADESAWSGGNAAYVPSAAPSEAPVPAHAPASHSGAAPHHGW